MARSNVHYLLIACALLGPAELRSQSWLTYRGTVDGTFTATCPTPSGGVAPTGGKVRFNFTMSGNDAKTRFASEWYPGSSASPRTSAHADLINAEGNASGREVFLVGGGQLRWAGRFTRAGDGSVSASGSITPGPDDYLGCTGSWSAGAAGAPTAGILECDAYSARIQAAEKELRNNVPWQDMRESPWTQLVLARDEIQETSKRITAIKSGALRGNIEAEQDLRRQQYARVTQLKAIIRKVEMLSGEVTRLKSEAAAAGCGGIRMPTQPKTGVDKAIDEILELDTSTQPSPSESDRIVGIAGITGTVQVRSVEGTVFSPTNGTRIGLSSQGIRISTGPGSTVTIQVGSVRRTLQPMTSVQLFPPDAPSSDRVEKGVVTVDVRKPAAYQIRTPTATTKVDGTVFTVSYDPATGVTGIMDEEGRVTVQPEFSVARRVTLSAGEYVEVGRAAMTAVLPAPGAPDVARRETTPPAQTINLTGFWQDDTGGGAIYRLRQIGDRVYWIVDGTPMGSYVNFSSGQIAGNTVTGSWVDLPGSPSLSGGMLTLTIESNDRLVKVGSGGYGAQSWTRANNAAAKGSPIAGNPASTGVKNNDLTGLWQDDSGGGAIYRIRQAGNQIFWIVDGTSKGSYTNLAIAVIAGNTINGKWVDMPGSPTLGGGDISLRIESNDRLVKVSSSTNYGAQAWTRLGSTSGDGIKPGRYLTVRASGGVADVNWSSAPTAPGSWVSIVPVGTSDGAHVGRWKYTENQPSGSYRNGPLTPGSYEARFYADAGYGQLVDRVRFEVVADVVGAFQIGGGAPPVSGGQQGQILRVQVDNRANATLTWSNAPVTHGVWVSVVPVGTPDGAHVGKWNYTEQKAAGMYQTGPLSPGEYEARFYGDAGYGKIIERLRFRVAP